MVGAFGSYQTAGELYITLLEVNDRDYWRELILNEGLARVTCGGHVREYFISPTYNTAVVRVTGQIENANIRYEREGSTIIHEKNEIIAVGYLTTKFSVMIRHEVKDSVLYLYITAATVQGLLHLRVPPFRAI